MTTFFFRQETNPFVFAMGLFAVFEKLGARRRTARVRARPLGGFCSSAGFGEAGSAIPAFPQFPYPQHLGERGRLLPHICGLSRFGHRNRRGARRAALRRRVHFGRVELRDCLQIAFELD